jgi:hypothetical protein
VTDVFISYRRGDAAGHAGRLADGLTTYYGRDHVFMDLDSIGPGVDFVARIEQAVGACNAALVLIGDGWVSAADAEGTRRLDDPADFVRVEVAEALARDGIKVIPVLVEGAKMPAPEELPEDIRKLSRHNAIELSDARWNYDVDRLKQAIGEPKKPLRTRVKPRIPAWAIVGAVLLAAGGAAAALLLGKSGGGSDDPKVQVKNGSYKGQLSDGSPIQFNVTGGVVRDIQFNAPVLCQSSQGLPERQTTFPFRGLPTTKGKVSPDGSFKIHVNFPEQTFRMEGDITKDGSGEGNVREFFGADQSGRGPIQNGVYTCDTGPMGWTAKG